MNQTVTIAKRELTSLFYSPIAYVVLGLFGFGASLIFFRFFGPGQQATLRQTFDGIIWLMIFLMPAISMRMISEELRSGTVEMLVTSPLTDTQVIVGKWLGTMGFLAVLLSPLLVLVGVLEINGDPDYGPIFSGLLGLMLAGGLYLAIGCFASATTQDQIISFVFTVFIICLLTFLMYFLPDAPFIGPGLREAMFYMNVNRQYGDYSKGLIDIANLVYFVSGIMLFLFLAVMMLQSRRWR
ncbi:MAG: ABC transporter permease [Phycisphaeraceae bacterium]